MMRGRLCHRVLTRQYLFHPNLSRDHTVAQQYRSVSSLTGADPYWQRVPRWKNVSTEEFLSYSWQTRNTISDKFKLLPFLQDALPEKLGESSNEQLNTLKTKNDFIKDALDALRLAPMAVRLTPHVLSRIDWNNPLDDPVRKQFLPLRSGLIPDHEKLTLDSLGEEADSPTPGLVHRYPGRALFLATSICPVYCRFCTRSYAVGPKTEVADKRPQKPSLARWDKIFAHLESHPDITDIVVSGGDAYYLAPKDLKYIGEKLLGMEHIRRIRFASKGLAVCPSRILDPNDQWASTLIDLSNQGRQKGVQVCLHTHINSPQEITWVTEMAARKLFAEGVIVRNQAVLLKGVNNSETVLLKLITELANMNIQPYYIYQCDMVKGIEDLRTPLSEILELDKVLRGQLSGFMMPSFVIDLPGGGGKRLVSTKESYCEKTGVAKYKAPGLSEAKRAKVYTYYDPKPVDLNILKELRHTQEQALTKGVSMEDFEALSRRAKSPALPTLPPLTLPPHAITPPPPTEWVRPAMSCGSGSSSQSWAPLA